VIRSASLFATLALLTSCDPQATSPVRPGLVLDLDGLEVHEAELQPLLAYLDTTGERLGHSYKVQAILDRHSIPLKLAQRAFGVQRQPLAAQAETLRRAVLAAGGADPQLREKAAKIRGAEATGLTNRSVMDLAQAAWCFNPDNLGLVSPVIELPHGYCLLSFADHRPGLQRSQDEVDVFLVPFFTHDVKAFDRWYAEQQKSLVNSLRYCHPDYVDALPTWLRSAYDAKKTSR
jgi:hypothetical protein